MTILTGVQVRELAVQAGFNDGEAVIVATIAKGESGWDTNAIGDTGITTAKWGPSIGLMQIRSLKNPPASGTDALRDASKLTDPATNMKAAYAIYKDRGSFDDWSVWKNRNRDGSTWNEDTKLAVQGGATTTGGVTATDAGNGDLDPTDGALAQVGKLAANLNNPDWWKRVGIGAAGYSLILVGLLFVLLSNNDVKAAGKAVAGGAVTLVPGGGAVTKAAGAVKGAAKSAASVTKGT